MANDVKSKVILGIDVNEFRQGIQKVDSSIKTMSRQFQNLGGVIGAAFVVGKIQAFSSEALTLGLRMDTVRRAFYKLNTEADLNRLRGAVRGTISDLDLMRRANQAANIGISMDTLATTLKYVQQYARATGEDMEKLFGDATQELVRQTGLRLDQLGINLLEVRKREQELGDYTEAVLSVMSDNMKNFGDETETAADKVDQLKTSWENFKAGTGEILKDVATVGLGFLQLGGQMQTEQASERAKRQAALKRFGTLGNTGAVTKIKPRPEPVPEPVVAPVIQTLELLREKLEATKKAFESVEIGTAQFYELRDSIEASEQKIKDLTQGVVPQTEALKLNAKTTNDVYEAQEKSLRIMRQLPDAGMAYAESLKDISRAQENYDRQLSAATTISAEFGYILNTAFKAAVTDGEDFFKKMQEGIKAYIQQMIAATAATLALAAALSIIFPKIGFKALFNAVGGGMGLPFGFGDASGQMGLRIAGNDFYTGMERNNTRNTRTGG